MFLFDKNDLSHLSLGANLLGSGGGGSTEILNSLVYQQLEQQGPVPIISLKELQKDSLIIPLAFVGAPSETKKMKPNNQPFHMILNHIQKDFINRSIVLMPAEIGGCNALTPFVIAGERKLKILDADLIGRAFPKIHMCKPAVLGIVPRLAYIASQKGQVIKLEIHSISELEEKIRKITVEFNSSSVVATFLMNPEEARRAIIPASLSHAIQLGKDAPSMKHHQTGIITQHNNLVDQGFLKGSVTILTKAGTYKIFFQNEYLLMLKNNKKQVESPSIIHLIDEKTGHPLSSENLKRGLRVKIISLPAPAFWCNAFSKACVSGNVFDFI